MPTDRLALAVGVGCEIDAVGFFCRVGKALYYVLLIRGYLVMRLEIVGYLNSERLFGQIANVSARRVNAVLTL